MSSQSSDIKYKHERQFPYKEGNYGCRASACPYSSQPSEVDSQFPVSLRVLNPELSSPQDSAEMIQRIKNSPRVHGKEGGGCLIEGMIPRGFRNLAAIADAPLAADSSTQAA